MFGFNVVAQTVNLPMFELLTVSIVYGQAFGRFDYQSGDFKEIATVTGKTTYNDIKLNHNQTYCYKVMVKRPKACPVFVQVTLIALSETAAALMFGFNVVAQTVNLPMFELLTVSIVYGLKAAAVSDKAIKVTWTNTKSDNASTRYATGYTLSIVG
jgi:hypothetical protein